MGTAGMHESTENRPPPDRRDQIAADWPRILEPVELGDETVPMLTGQSVQTSRAVIRDQTREERRLALALMRYPRGTSPNGSGLRDSRHVLVIMMQGDDAPDAYPSQISALVPSELDTQTPKRLSLEVRSEERSDRFDVEVRRSKSAWTTETFHVRDVPRPGEHVSVVIIGSRWRLPAELTLQVSDNVRAYVDAFYSRVDNGR